MLVNEIQELKDLFDTYIAAFNRGDFKACVACYRVPFTFITSRGVSVLQDEEAFLSMWRANHAQLVDQGWSYSRALRADARLLDENLALVSVMVARHRADGSQDETVAGLYNARKGRDGWKLITATSHRADTYLALV